MRGADVQKGGRFSYVLLESRTPAKHPLRADRTLLDEAIASMSRDFDRVLAEGGRISVPPGRLARAVVLQVLYSIRDETHVGPHGHGFPDVSGQTTGRLGAWTRLVET